VHLLIQDPLIDRGEVNPESVARVGAVAVPYIGIDGVDHVPDQDRPTGVTEAGRALMRRPIVARQLQIVGSEKSMSALHLYQLRLSLNSIQVGDLRRLDILQSVPRDIEHLMFGQRIQPVFCRKVTVLAQGHRLIQLHHTHVAGVGEFREVVEVRMGYRGAPDKAVGWVVQPSLASLDLGAR
jgi:hypothetical protein